MKYLFTLIFLIFLACKNSMPDSKKETIKVMLDIHNQSTKLKFTLDSIEAASKYEISLLPLRIKKDSVESFIKAHMGTYKYHWNEPYKIKKDYELTYDKYIDYCKAHKLDPETYYKFLD